MLVLTRRKQQEVAIIHPNGTIVKVKVVKMEGGKVQLGFECPDDVRIERIDRPELKELYSKKEQ